MKTAPKRLSAADKRATLDVAWTLVRRDNMEIRTSHPKVYRWARAYIDSTKEI